jgi:hypothetical protein
MEQTADFDVWLSDSEPETNDDAFDLADAVDGESSGIYNVQVSGGGKLFITRDGGEYTLKLLSPAAIAAFKKRIAAYNPYPDLGWDGAKVFYQGMKKND